MNKTKRGFELAGAIITIVLISFLILISLVFVLGAYDTNELFVTINGSYAEITEEQLQAVINLFRTVFALLLFFSVAVLVLAIILCIPPKVLNGKYQSRFGVSLAISIMLGILTLLLLSNLLGLLFAVPLAFIIVSMCLKHNVIYDTTNITSVYNYNNQKVDSNEPQDNQNQ